LFDAWIADRRPVVTQSWVDSEGVTRSRTTENPLVRQLRLQRTLCDSLLGAFGLTPATRSKVTTHDGDEADEAETFLQSRPTIVAFRKRR
jgi:phage terminase small subunit